MTRTLVLLASGLMVAALTLPGGAASQEPAGTPEPKLPPMPSMEGQQGDVSKPVTQIPPRKKAVPPEKKAAPEKKTTPAKKAPARTRPAAPRKKR